MALITPWTPESRLRTLQAGRLSALLVVLALSVLAATSEAATHQVPGDFNRIVDAVAAASPGDSIVVAPGTYSTADNGETFPILINKSLDLIGAGMSLSTIDADFQAAVIRIESTCRVRGFTVTRGESIEGGGIRIVSGSPEIRETLVLENRASFVGSGIFVAPGATPWIHHCVVWGNYDTDILAPGDPHGIQFRDSGGLVEFTLVGRSDSNGLLINTLSNPTVRNNIFFENGTPGLRGRGICVLDTTTAPVVAHNLFYGNIKAALLVLPSIGDVTGLAANDIDPGDGIYGNLDGDPEFIAPDASEWHLRSTSPAIDAGDPASPLDPDGSVADIGPFFFNQTLGIEDPRPGVLQFASFPNPAAGPATLTYRIEHPSPVSLTVHDLRGRKILTLRDDTRDAGLHAEVWNGRDESGRRVAAGAYFARLVVGGLATTQKIILVR